MHSTPVQMSMDVDSKHGVLHRHSHCQSGQVGHSGNQKISKFHKLPHCHVWMCVSLCMSLLNCENQHCAVCQLSASQSKHATFTVALA